ncbi:MAG: asparagine synthetase B, partial [Gammaproteobacteria bacterium]|nr:asparagine synthetase B [Gammaproteobacteria bacterium]
MCGLTGFWDFKAATSEEKLLHLVSEMALSIQFRGPDSQGIWCDPKVGLAFGHRRLAIVDLSPAGHQPMLSHSGRSVIIYNGEIFNTDDLRSRLKVEGCVFHGYSDTEVLLEACEQWGVEKTCQQLIGMFSFAFWRVDDQQLFLARDRLGIKPLYWGFHEGILFFGSQLKSFLAHPHFKPVLNKNALGQYFRSNAVPNTLSIFEGVAQLEPGSIVVVDRHKHVHQDRFWD